VTVKRNTIQRKLVSDAVRELATHPTAEQVYEFLVERHSSISRATVYRNLNQMSVAGELSNIGSFFGSIHYDHKCHNHYHFICEECKQVFDIPAYLPDLSSKLADMDGFEVRNHSLSFNGLCPSCISTQDALR